MERHDVLAATFVDNGGQGQARFEPADAIEQPGSSLLGIILSQASTHGFAPALRCEPIDGLDDRHRVDHEEVVAPRNDRVVVALARVTAAVGKPLSRLRPSPLLRRLLGLLRGHSPVDARAAVVVDGTVWVHLFVAEPAPPIVSFTDLIEVRHGGNVAALINGARELNSVEQRQRGVKIHRGRAEDLEMYWFRRLGALLAMAVIVAACGGDDEPPLSQPTSIPAEPGTTVSSLGDSDESAWNELDEAEQRFESTVGRDYVVIFDFVSAASAEAGPIRVEVADGQPVAVTYPDTITELILPQIPMLTVQDFFDRARSVLDAGGLVEIEFDAPYGYPTFMNLDPIPDAIDDESSILVRSVEPLESSVESDGY